MTNHLIIALCYCIGPLVMLVMSRKDIELVMMYGYGIASVMFVYVLTWLAS